MRWCALALALAAAAAAEPAPGRVQLYVMPDTQSWAWNQGGTSLETWRGVADALCRQRERFALVLHTGDMVDHGRLQPEEWEHALSVMRRLDACKLPYAIAFGNHDFDEPGPQGNAAVQGDSAWKAFMAKLGQRPLATAPSGRSALHAFAPGWFVLTADYIATRADLDWISAAIGARRDARFVLLNHHCVSTAGLVASEAFAWCRTLVEQHPEVRVAVSGHWLGQSRDAWREVKRANAPPLVTLYQNYQHVPELAAWGVVMELDTASGALCVWSENLLSGELTHPAAASPEVGPIGAGSKKRCFGVGPGDRPGAQ